MLLLGGVQPCSAFNWRRPFGDTFISTKTFSNAFWWLFEATGSFDISLETIWTLFSGVELVSFNFGLPGWVGFLEVFGKKKD